MTENGGVFVCKTRHLVLPHTGKKSTQPLSEINMRSPFHPSQRLKSPVHPSSNSDGKSGHKFVGGHGQGAGRRRNELIGQTIKIAFGPYKGHIGIVKDSTDNLARVELHSKCQTISVDRSRIVVVGGPSKENVSSFTRTPVYGSQTPMHGNQTPMYGNQTPMLGSQTPMYGNQTPSYGSGSRTPIYGSQTPQYEAGCRTPHYGSQTPSQASSETGAWDPTVANTPAPSMSEDSEADYENLEMSEPEYALSYSSHGALPG